MKLYKSFYYLSKNRKLVTACLFFSFFLFGLFGTSVVSIFQASSILQNQLKEQISNLKQLKVDTKNTLSILHSERSPEPCSEEFLRWMRKVAFLPDGIHQILYTDQNVHCSVTQGKNSRPLDLGVPDLERRDLGYSFWFDRNIQEWGHENLRGTILKSGRFTLLLPDLDTMPTGPLWQNREFVTPLSNNEVRHRIGQFGLTEKYGLEQGVGLSLSEAAFWGYYCDPTNLLCLTIESPLPRLFSQYWLLISSIVLAILITSLILANLLTDRVRSFWSLPSRFRRLMSESTLICHYQPILSLENGKIVGVEVLVRWKDIDGSIVFPDKFLPIVEERNLSRELTRIVIKKSARELQKAMFDVDDPRVNINVFPKDFEANWLTTVLAPLKQSTRRFQPVVEIVESSDAPLERTRDAIALLRANGIKTYIDDFGVGYSSLHYLSGLRADGVKLDRFFALSPEGSLSSTMLFSVIEMVSKTGQKLVVEGVETEARLMSLRATNKVDLVQGYYISPPVSIDRLNEVLLEHAEKNRKQQTYLPEMRREITAAFSSA